MYEICSRRWASATAFKTHHRSWVTTTMRSKLANTGIAGTLERREGGLQRSRRVSVWSIASASSAVIIIALLLSLVSLHCVQACEASKGSLVSWALGFPQFWRACFPLMQRQRAESLADREQSLLPLLGHRRLDQDPSGRVQIELNLDDPCGATSWGGEMRGAG